MLGTVQVRYEAHFQPIFRGRLFYSWPTQIREFLKRFKKIRYGTNNSTITVFCELAEKDIKIANNSYNATLLDSAELQ